MPRFNTTIDDNSPLITYAPTESWSYGSSTADLYASSYANGSFTLTTQTNATATFRFNGTGVWIYGAKRPNHGMYTVTLDGQTSKDILGSTSDGIRDLDFGGNEFEAVLYGAYNLSLDSHEVVLTNKGNQGLSPQDVYVDIDYIIWENSVGPDNASLSISTLDFETSGSGWTSAVTNNELGTATGMYTNVAGDSAEISFEVRDSAEIYGSVGQLCGFYDVEIDGGVSTTYNATTHHNFTNQLLFSASNLGSGQHTMKITKSELGTGSLVIDHAQTRVIVPATSANTSSDPTNTSANTTKKSNKALIGGICGALAFALILLVALYLWVKQRRRVAIVSKKASASKIEAFDIDQFSPPPSQVSMRQSSLSELLQSSKATQDSPSDTSSSDIREHSIATSSKPSGVKSPQTERSRKAKRAHSPRKTHDEHLGKVASGSKLPHDILTGNASRRKLPHDNASKDGSQSKSRSKEHRGHRSHKPRSHDKHERKHKRPLPDVPRASSSNDLSANGVPASQPPRPHQMHRSTSMLKGRRRSLRNSRIVQASYNFFFAQPGSSNSGSAYAPTTVLTSEISERPTTTLSPVTEAPPPLPPSRSHSPQSPRPLQIVNQVDET